MICDIGIVKCLFLKSKMAAKYFALCQNLKAFPSQFAFENIGNRTKTDLVTLILLNAKDLSKIIMLIYCNSKYEV